MVLKFGGQRKYYRMRWWILLFRMMEFLMSTKLSKLSTSSSL